MRKLKKKFIDTDSNDYKNYTIMVMWKFQLFPFFFLLSLFFLIGSVNIHSDFSLGILLFLISLGCLYIGTRVKWEFSFRNMIKFEETTNINKKFIQEIREMRQRRIKAVVFCVKLVSWLISFLIIDSIADNVRQVLNLHTVSDFIAIIEILLASLILIFALQKLIYWITIGFVFLFCKAKNLVRYFVYNGMFVSGYIILTVIDNGLTEILNNDQDNED